MRARASLPTSAASCRCDVKRTLSGSHIYWSGGVSERSERKRAKRAPRPRDMLWPPPCSPLSSGAGRSSPPYGGPIPAASSPSVRSSSCLSAMATRTAPKRPKCHLGSQNLKISTGFILKVRLGNSWSAKVLQSDFGAFGAFGTLKSSPWTDGFANSQK